jgi:MFS superfamily sulfate permease-like transporter
MLSLIDGRTSASWVRETAAGCTGAAAVLPVVVTLGLLAYAPLGAAAPSAALPAAFLTAGIGGLVHASVSRTSLPVSGLSSPSALTLAALVTQLVADPRLAPGGAAGVPMLVALCALALLLSGALQILLALLGLARLTRLAPQPVLAGFMNSAALLVLLAQVPLLLDLPPGAMPTPALWSAVHPAALVLGLGTACAIWLLRRRWPQAPVALLVMVVGTTAHQLWSAAGTLPAAGATIGPLPPAWPWAPPLVSLLSLDAVQALDLLRAHGGQVLLTALALATIGALESSLNMRAIDQLLNTRHDPRHELLALGCSNMVCGLIGGLPTSATRTRALATLQAGGRGRVAALTGPAVLLLLYLVGGPWLAALPMPVLAGVMLVVGLGLADRWTGRLLGRLWAGDRSHDLALGLGVVVLVVVTTLWKGMAVGVGLGMLLSLLAFAARMNRSPVRDRYLASARPSRRVYLAPVEARLRPLRAGITVLELDGALFFGTSDRLLDEIDALPAGCRFLVLDLRRVAAIDESGAVALQQAAARLRARGTAVELAGLSESSAAAQALHGLGVHLPRWPDADRAIEAAEHRLLGEPGDVRAMAEVPLAASALLAGLDAAGVDLLAARMPGRRLEAGEVLFAEGEPGDRLFVVTQGSVSAVSGPDARGHSQRYLSVSPGMMIGETAMLDGGGRTATVVADASSVVHALTLQALDEIGRNHPAVAILLHRNLALHQSQRLRAAAAAWHVSTR